MPIRRFRMLFTALLLVSALGLSFTVGALALERGEASALSAPRPLSVVNAPESAATASPSNTGSASPSDADSSISDSHFSSSGFSGSFSDISAVEANSQINLSDGSTGQLDISLGEISSDIITPGMSFCIPVYLATDNLCLWTLKLSVSFNKGALELLQQDTVEDWEKDGTSITANPDNGEIFVMFTDNGDGLYSDSFDQPVRIFSLWFKMPNTPDAVSAVEGSYSPGDGSSSDVRGKLDFKITVSEITVTPGGSAGQLLDKDQRDSISGNNAAAFSPEQISADETHYHTYCADDGITPDPTKGVEFDATCTSRAKIRYACDLCDDVYEEEFGPLPSGSHSWGPQTADLLDKPDGAAPCLPFKARLICSQCGALSDAADAVFVDSVPDGYSPVPHSLSFHPGNDATDSVPGNIPYYTCSVCSLIFKADSNASAANGTSYALVSNICTLNDTVIPAGGEKPTKVTGDINGDGEVDGTDSTILTRYAAGNQAAAVQKWFEEGAQGRINADINDDDEVDGTDSTILARYAAGNQAEAVQKWFRNNPGYVAP